MKQILVAGLVSLSSFACAKPNPPAVAPPPREVTRDVYRIELVVASRAPGKPESKSTQTLTVEEGDVAVVRYGANVPLSTNARTDVGLRLECKAFRVGDDVLLRSDLEMSSMDDASAVKKISMRDETLLAFGKTAVVSTLEDPVTHGEYEISATATRLR